jgi:hypothetical protein
VKDKYFEKLCDWLRDAEEPDEIQRAAKALRRYLQEQQFSIRRRLNPYLERAFASLGRNQNQSN